MARILALFCVLALAVPSANAADFDAGVVAFLEGDFAGALGHWQPLADEGHAGAQFNLGAMYRDGRGVPLDLGEAAWWFTKSAQTGHARAQYGLGVMYAEGVAVPMDLNEAAKWFGSAADRGHAQAQYEFAVLLTNGEGIAQDRVGALKWLQLAGEAGVEAAVVARELLAAEMAPPALAYASRMARIWSAQQGQTRAPAR